MTDETPESVEKRTKEDGKFLGIMAQEFSDISFSKVFKAAEQARDSAAVVAESSDKEFTAIIKNVGQRTSLEKVTNTLRASAHGKGILIAGATVAAAAISLGFLVKRFKNRQAPQAHMPEQGLPQAVVQEQGKTSSASSLISQIGEMTGMDKSVTGAAQNLVSGKGLSLTDVVKAGSALAAAKEGENGQITQGLAAAGQLANALGGNNGQGAPLPDVLSSVMGLFGGQGNGQSR